MKDTTLLDSTEPISMEALQALFHANDFSTMVSRYDAEGASNDNNEFFMKVKGDLSDCLEPRNGRADENEFPYELF